MRFIFVYQDFADRLQTLLREHNIGDVHAIIVRKGFFSPLPDEKKLLQQHTLPNAASCQVDRKYLKQIRDLVLLQYEAKKFRDDDKQLLAWLIPKEETRIIHPSPSISFTSSTHRRMVLAAGALDRADELTQRRWAFIAEGVSLLRRLSDGEDLGPMREWKSRYGVDFAANGRVKFEYVISGQKGIVRKTEWHLKSGDNTDAADAARVYFCFQDYNNLKYVFVLYCGPHPEDGVYKVQIDSSTLQIC